MKQIQLNMPDEQAGIFAEKLSELVKECGGTIHIGEDNALFDTSKPIWERIKTIEDAIAYTGMSLPDGIEDEPIDIQAFLKLRIVCAAYNELRKEQLDQFPKFTTDEYRYYPWFELFTEEELAKMSEEQRGRVLGRSVHNAVAYAGVAFSRTYYGSSYSYTSYGGRLCFIDHERARECGKRFLRLWAQYHGFIKE